MKDARISWTDEAEAIDRQIRACTPHPGAWTELFAEGPIADNDESTAKSLALHILAAQPADQSNPNTPAELQPHASPPPPACDNKQYRSRLRKHSKGPASS